MGYRTCFWISRTAAVRSRCRNSDNAEALDDRSGERARARSRLAPRRRRVALGRQFDGGPRAAITAKGTVRRHARSSGRKGGCPSVRRRVSPDRGDQTADVRRYAPRMSLPQDAHLVTVTDGGRPRDGIVFDRPSPTKVVVAVIDQRRGPVFRTLNPSALSQRAEPGDDDVQLRRLIRRTPPPAGRRHSSTSAGQAAHAAHTRGAAHRTTGR